MKKALCKKGSVNSELLLLFYFVAIIFTFASNPVKLSGQQRLDPARTIMDPPPYKSNYIIFGLGFGLSLPLLTPNGTTQFADLKNRGYSEPLHIIETLHIHLAFAFPPGFGEIYSLGFAIYLMGSHQSSSAVNAEPDFETSSEISIGRAYVIFSPAFYNQVTFSPSFIIQLGVGPSLMLSFVDYQNVLTAGTRSVTGRPDPLALDFGLYLATGMQFRFSRTLGMSLEFAGHIFFTGSKGHQFNNVGAEWTNTQIYLGSLGAVVSLLFYM